MKKKQNWIPMGDLSFNGMNEMLNNMGMQYFTFYVYTHITSRSLFNLQVCLVNPVWFCKRGTSKFLT